MAKADPTANLSFNLNLTEEQRRAKNDTVLPYMKTQGDNPVSDSFVVMSVSHFNHELRWLISIILVFALESSGAIYYEPDAADDFDDDDPDDDLTI